jgi:hypothetical protein
MVKKSELLELISQAEAARLRGVTREAIYNLVRRGRLRTKKVLDRTWLYRSEVMAYEREKPGPKSSTKKKGGKK